MAFVLIILLLAACSDHLEATSMSPDCRDKEAMCKMLIQSMPNFCLMTQHSHYAAENCQWSCELCDVKPSSLNHGTNLIWAQTPQTKLYTVSRLVSIQGDPNTWVTNRKPQVTYISAPHYTWEFKALGFHWEDQTLFWSESMNKKIQSLVLNGSTDTRALFAGTSPEVYGIAVDWLSRNVYFTDALYNWIMMTSSNPSHHAYKIVVQDQLDSPHGVAVYPQKGYLIWSDWGERPKIEISDLLGANRRPLVERDIVKPKGLTVDYDQNSLYWVDTFKATVEVVQFNGQGRRVIHQEEGTNFYGVALYNDFIFVTERSRGMLKVFNQQMSLVSFTLGNIPYDIVMYDSSRQPDNSTECEDLACEQLCVLDPLTGARCLCGEGYTPEDNHSISCKPSHKFVHPSHIYAIRDSICQYPANLADMSLTNVTLDSQCFLEDRQGYMTLAFDARENMIYYFGNNTKTISRLPLELGGKSKVITGSTGVVKGMALDWMAGNLYWTDSTYGVIKVARKTGAYQMTILENLTHPVGIAVHPGRGQIFWTDHGQLPGKGGSVERANMDGSGRAIVMADNIGEPNHLYIDYEKDLVYWADSVLHHVRQLDLNTGRITVAYQQPTVKFYGLSFFKDFILWTDTEDLNGIHIARMDKKEKVRGIIHPRNGLAADLITFDIQNQPSFNNTCTEGLISCSQLCLVSQGNTSRCFCGVGYELSLDGFTCSSSPVMDNFLLVNDAYQRQIFQVNLKTAVVEAVDLPPSHEPIALAYDPFEVKVFWSDNKANVIKEATIDGRYEKTVMLMTNASMCDGLAADYINKLLFFTDTGLDVIGVISLRNYELFTYIITTFLDEPRDIEVSPNQGIIYWSDWGSPPRIEKANMDGSERETLVDFNSVAWPNGLAFDLQENKLFWVDAHADKISVMDLASRRISDLVAEPEAHYFSVDIIGEYLYVTDWKTNYLKRMNKKGGPLKQFGPAQFTRLYGIKGYNSSESFKGISVCVASACDHLCLPKANNQYSCRCATGYTSQDLHCMKQASTESPIPLPMSTAFVSNEPSPTHSPTPETTMQPVVTSPQHTSLPTSSIPTTTRLTTMTSPISSTQSTSEAWEINTTIEPTYGKTTEKQESPENSTENSTGTALRITGTESSAKGLSPAIIGVIVGCILLVFIIAFTVAILYRRHYKYIFRHGKLIEEKNPADFYKIAFPSRGEDNVTFDTGIENPTYDCLHDPTICISQPADTRT
ncbi:hypothetical protein BsWGS_09085 [Bradybaena similaris]